ncbi:hypothetical protein ABT061_48260, partial [Streptosporangium sp. NPDC002544]
LVNNAGVATRANLLTGDLDTIRLELDTHVFGILGVIRAFAPVLASNGGRDATGPPWSMIWRWCGWCRMGRRSARRGSAWSAPCPGAP